MRQPPTEVPRAMAGEPTNWKMYALISLKK
jgi:hypothetical protein